MQPPGREVGLELCERRPGGFVNNRRGLVPDHAGLRTEESLELIGLLLQEMVELHHKILINK